jgi:hypothetical protein
MERYETREIALQALRAVLDEKDVPDGEVRRRIETRAVKHDSGGFSSKRFWHLPKAEDLDRIIADERSRA